MNDELWEVLQSFKSAIDMCMDKVDQMDKMYEDYRNQTDERIHALENTLYEEIINPTKAYVEEENRNARFNDFNEKYGEKLGAYNDALRPLEGDDFDLTKSAFDKYDSFEGEKPGEDEYVDALIEEVGAQLNKIKEGLGLPADAEIEVKQTEDGETVVEVEGENGEEQIIATEDGENVEEAEEIVDDEPVEDNPEEVEAFEKELEQYR